MLNKILAVIGWTIAGMMVAVVIVLCWPAFYVAFNISAKDKLRHYGAALGTTLVWLVILHKLLS